MQKHIVKGLLRAPLIFIVLLFLGSTHVQAQPATTSGRDSSEIVRLSWKASKDGDLKTL